MPFTMPDFTPSLSPEQVNPLYGAISGLLKGIKEGPSMYESMVKAKYALPEEQQALQKAVLENQWYGPDKQSEIGLRGAQAGLFGSQTKKNLYELNHPGYMGSEATKTIQALVDMGLIKPDQLKNSSVNPSQTSQSNNQQNNMNVDSASNNFPNTVSNKTSNNASSSSPEAISVALNNPDVSPTEPNIAPFKTGNNLVDSILNKPYADAAYQQKMTMGFNYVHAPVQAKNYMIAQLAGAGIDPSEAVQLLTNGMSVPQILTQKGFDPKNPPDPDFLPTQGNIQQLNQRKAALAATQSIGKYITEGLGPYSQTIMGYSIPQMADALNGMNKQQQIKFLAARGLVPEYTTMRLTAAGGKATVHAIVAMQQASLNNIKALRALVTPDVWEAAQKEIDNQIGNAMNSANDSYTVGKKSNSSSNKITWIRDENGNLKPGE